MLGACAHFHLRAGPVMEADEHEGVKERPGERCTTGPELWIQEGAEQLAYFLGISQMKLYEGGAVLVLGVFTKGISCHGEMSLPPPSRKWTR